MDIEHNGLNNITSITYDNSVPKLLIERAWHDVYTNQNADELPLSDSFVSAQKDGDNIKLTKISGAQTTVGPFSGGGAAASSTTQHPTSAMTSNSLPSPLVAVGSTEYNLFTDKLFGTDNLGNLGTVDQVGGHSGEVKYWALDPADNM